MEKQSQVLKTVRLCRGGKVNACVTAIWFSPYKAMNIKSDSAERYMENIHY